jgi:hypothetical protein
MASRRDQQDSFNPLRSEQRHHVNLTRMIALRIEDAQEIASLSSGAFGPADDLGEEWDGYIRDHHPKRMRPVGLQAARDQIWLVVEDPNCFKDFLPGTFTYSRGAGNHIGHRS